MEASDSSDFTEEPQHAIYTITNKVSKHLLISMIIIVQVLS